MNLVSSKSTEVDNDMYTILQWSDALRNGAWHPQISRVLNEVLPLMLKQRPCEKTLHDTTPYPLPEIEDAFLKCVAQTIHPTHWGSLLFGECIHQPLQELWRHKIANFIDRTPALLKKIPLPDLFSEQGKNIADLSPLPETENFPASLAHTEAMQQDPEQILADALTSILLSNPVSTQQWIRHMLDRQSNTHRPDIHITSVQQASVVCHENNAIRELSSPHLSLTEERLRAIELTLHS